MGFGLELLPRRSVGATTAFCLEGKEGGWAGNPAAARRKSTGRMQEACGNISPVILHPPGREAA